MLFMVKVAWDVEKGNELARSGELGHRVQSILEALKPEAAYFSATNGRRGGVLFVEMDRASQIPAIAEPFFLTANATVKIEPVMRPQDLADAQPDIERAVKQFG